MSPPSRRPLGRSALRVAPIAFGGNVFGWTVDERMGFDLLDRFVDAGLNLIDTADVYSSWVPGHKGGESEAMIGRWLKATGRRNEVLLATKVGMEMPGVGTGLSSEHIRRSLDASLARLQTDYVDLYQAHQDDATTPLEETLGTFGELLDAGRVRAVGASNYTAERLEQALAVSRDRGLPRYESLQPRYNLMDRTDFESALSAVCARQGLGVLTYSSLASGFLTGKYRREEDLAKSARGFRVASRLTPRGRRILASLDAVAERQSAGLSTVALAWLLTRPTVTAPIASATSPQQLQHLVDAISLHLTPSDLRELEAASQPDPGP